MISVPRMATPIVTSVMSGAESGRPRAAVHSAVRTEKGVW
jgi:hypothetical protein